MATFKPQRSAELRYRRMRRAGFELLHSNYDLNRWRETWEAAGTPLVRELTAVCSFPGSGWPPLEVRTWIPEGWSEILPTLARCLETERVLLIRWCAQDREFLEGLRVQVRLAHARGEDAVEVFRDIGWSRMTEREVAVFPRRHDSNRGKTFSGTLPYQLGMPRW